MTYNFATGLSDVNASTVRTIELTTDTLSSETGALNFMQCQLSNVALVNGINIQQTSQTAQAASNHSISNSNAVWPALSQTNITAQAASNHSISNSNVFHQTFSSTSTTTSTLRGNMYSHTVSACNLDLTQGGVIRVGSNAILETDGKVDYKWIKNAPAFSNDGILSSIGVGLGAAGLLGLAAQQLMSQTGQIGPAVAQDIAKKLGEQALEEAYDPDDEEDAIKVHWNNIVFKPFHQNPGALDIGLASNVYVNSNSSLYSIRASDLTKVDAGRFKRLAGAPSVRKVIDFAERKFFGTDFTGCNFTASNNITCDNLLTTVVTAPTVGTSNMTAWNIATSNSTSMNSFCSNLSTKSLWIGDSGVWTQNPSQFPFSAVQVVDAFGNYKGSVMASQVISSEALNFSSLADGVVSLQGSGASYTSPFGFAENAFFTLN